MSESRPAVHAYFEIMFPDRPRQMIPVSALPFYIGRGKEYGNHLILDDGRISRKCVTICSAPDGLQIEDRGQLGGILVNGEQISGGRLLTNGDRIQLGVDDACQLVFRSSLESRPKDDGAVTLRTLLESLTGEADSELNRLTLLLEATSLLHSRLPLESIFSTMLDYAIAITQADRGMLLEPDAAGTLQVRVARSQQGNSLPLEAMNPSRTVLRQAVQQRTAVVNEDLRLADLSLQTAHSVVLQFLRSAVVIPLYNVARENDGGSGAELLGALYLDSKRAAAFSVLDRKMLDALGTQAASILDNARLMQRERERQRLEQELNIARHIQQALVPQGLHDCPHLAMTGIHRPCHEVGGDYFDVFPLTDGRTAILIADVAGKGLGAALLATMLQGALSGMTLGVEPVRVFEHLNRFLCERAELCRYATMFFALLDPDGGLEFVSAGHPSPLLLRHGMVTELYTEGSFPIGLVAGATFTANRILLEPQDTLLMFTDGITEAEDQERNLFGFSRLVETLCACSDCSLDELQSKVLCAVEKFSCGARQSDDITLLAIRYQGKEQEPGSSRNEVGLAH